MTPTEIIASVFGGIMLILNGVFAFLLLRKKEERAEHADDRTQDRSDKADDRAQDKADKDTDRKEARVEKSDDRKERLADQRWFNDRYKALAESLQKQIDNLAHENVLLRSQNASLQVQVDTQKKRIDVLEKKG